MQKRGRSKGGIVVEALQYSGRSKAILPSPSEMLRSKQETSRGRRKGRLVVEGNGHLVGSKGAFKQVRESCCRSKGSHAVEAVCGVVCVVCVCVCVCVCI